MTFGDRLNHAKRKAKRYLAMSSNNSSSAWLLVSADSNSSPDPGTETPLPRTSIPSSFSTSSFASSFVNLIPSALVDKMASGANGPTNQASASSSSPLVPRDIDVVAGTNSRRRIKGMVWSGLKALLKVVESSSDVFPPLKSAVSGLNKCIDIFESASKGRKEYQQLQKKLDSLFRDLSEHIGGTTSAKVTMGMKNLCMALNEELALLQEKGARGVLGALDQSNEIMECYKRIQGHLERLTLNANLSIWEIVDRMEAVRFANSIPHFLSAPNTLGQEARLQKLSTAILAVYNSAEAEDVQRRECTPGTREEELAKLLAWARNKASEKRQDIFWMNGMAGTGKTTITYSLCTELERSGELGASFFCSRLIPECRNIKLIIPAIAYQLARYSLPFRCALSMVLEADPDAHIRVLKTQFDSLIVKPLTQVKHTLPTDFVVVIDALDECDNENAAGQILNVLVAGITASELPIRFLLSSRPEPEIYTRMVQQLGDSQDSRLILHDLDQGKVKRDIETFLRVELHSINLSSFQLADLVDRSGVLFIFASTAARYIKDGIRLGQHEKRLKIVLDLKSASSHGSHRDIDQLYSSILIAVFDSRYLDEDDRTLMKMVLDTAICAQEPMTVTALAGLLGLTDGQQVDGLLRPLCSVVNIAEASGLVTTLHASFPDFMFDPQRSSTFHCDAMATHTRVSQACFQVIRFNEPLFNVAALESSYLRDCETPGLNERVEELISEQLYYSCRYWVAHLTSGGAQEKSEEWLHGLLSELLLLWMEVLNLKKNIHIGPMIIQQAEEWARENRYQTETVELTHDAWRFITMFASHAVSQSTPHIYVSMLAFWPASAPISLQYKKRILQGIRPQGTAMTRQQLALLSTWPFNEAVRSIAISPDSSAIACGLSASVNVVDGITGRAIFGPLDHNDEITAIAFSPDGTLLASCSKDQSVKLWKLSNGQLAAEPLVGHTDRVTSVCFTPDNSRVISGSRDRTIRIWNLKSCQMVVGPLHGHRGGVWSVCISSDGARIASGSDDKTIYVWDAQSGELLFGPLEGHTGYIWSVCFSSDNTRLVSGSDDSTIRIWRYSTNDVHVDVLKGHTHPVVSAVFSPNGKQVVSGSLDFTVRLWDVEGEPQLARVFEGHTNNVWCVRFTSDGARIVSCSGDQTIRVWDARSQGLVDSPFEGHTKAVTSVAFLHGDTRIVSGSNDGTMCVWDAKSGQVAVGPLMGHRDWVNSVCTSPGHSKIASASNDRTIRLWDAHTGKGVGEPLTGHSGKVLSVCFSPNGALLASGSEDKTIRLWNAESGEPIGSALKAHTRSIRSVCFSPDSLRLVSGSNDKIVLVWDVNTRKAALPPSKGHIDEVWAVCASPDGARIASGSKDTTVRLWDAHIGQSVLGPLVGHTDVIDSVCFSPDSCYLVSGSNDKTIRIWDVRSGQAVSSSLTGHTDLVRSVAFSQNGQRIVSGSDDLSARVWNVADLVQAREAEGDSDKDTTSSNVYQPWALQENGWVVDSDTQSYLLAWVPPNLHAQLMSPRNTLLISTKGSIQLDLESAALGDSWSDCYESLCRAIDVSGFAGHATLV